MAKLEIDSDLCSFWYNTNVPVTANHQDNLIKLLVGKKGNLEYCNFLVLGGCTSNPATNLDIQRLNRV